MSALHRLALLMLMIPGLALALEPPATCSWRTPPMTTAR
jgi:hypothetical protein